MYADAFKLDLGNYLKRKSVFEKRISEMIAYVKETTSCRSSFIADYFGDKSVKACGVCDNCINKKSESIPATEFNRISGDILKLINNQPISINILLQQIKNCNKEKLWRVINYLESEQKLTTDKNGIITLL